jgi:hypothetical protein
MPHHTRKVASLFFASPFHTSITSAHPSKTQTPRPEPNSIAKMGTMKRKREEKEIEQSERATKRLL